MDDKDFKKKFEEANPNIKLVRRTKERTEGNLREVYCKEALATGICNTHAESIWKRN